MKTFSLKKIEMFLTSYSQGTLIFIILRSSWMFLWFMGCSRFLLLNITIKHHYYLKNLSQVKVLGGEFYW